MNLDRSQIKERTFFECFTSDRYTWIRFIFAFVLPVGLAVFLAIEWHNIDWSIFWQTKTAKGLVIAFIIIMLFGWAFPWLFGTVLFGHVIIPYIGFIMTGKFCYFTFHYRKPSMLCFNDQTYYHFGHGWLTIPEYCLANFDNRHYSLEQIA